VGHHGNIPAAMGRKKQHLKLRRSCCNRQLLLRYARKHGCI